MNLHRLERELKKRHCYPYHWGRKQCDSWDRQTTFIYKTYSIESLIKHTNQLDKPLRDYAFNRWYNFWSAMAVENLFANHSEITPNNNHKDKFVDFSILGIPFDHKSSVFPKGFGKSYSHAQNNPEELIRWLYENQSSQGRLHYGNRLFLIMHDSKCGAHWKMKSELSLMKQQIDLYVNAFDYSNLKTINLGDRVIHSDIIWIESATH